MRNIFLDLKWPLRPEFLFAIHEESVMIFSKKNITPVISVILQFCPILSRSFVLKWQSRSCLPLALVKSKWQKMFESLGRRKSS